MEKKVLEYVGKRQRRLEREREKIEDRENINRPMTASQRIIKAIAERVAGYVDELIDVDASHDMYQQARECRHDLWLEFLEENRACETARFNDIQFGRFINQLRAMGLDVPECNDESVSGKTPDILYYDMRLQCAFLGDVAVSVTTQKTDKEKTRKYHPQLDYLRSQDFRVVYRNFIIDDDMSNLNPKAEEFMSIGVIKPDYKQSLIKYKAFHALANQVMGDIKLKVADKNSLNQKLTESREQIDFDITAELPHLASYTPKFSEEDVISSIRDQTDKNLETFFDESYEDSIRAFEKLVDSQNNRSHQSPRSTLQSVYSLRDYEQLNGHELIKNYVCDSLKADPSPERDFLLNLLPTVPQLLLMQNLTSTHVEKRSDIGVFGRWQYKPIPTNDSNFLYMRFKTKLSITKKNPGIKEEPKTISPREYDSCSEQIERMVMHLGETSNKTPVNSSEKWQSATNMEIKSTEEEFNTYEYIRRTNGVQLAHALSHFYQRLVHLKAQLVTKQNVYVPPNGAFIVVKPGEHASTSASNAEIPFIFIARCSNRSSQPPMEYEHSFATKEFTYYIGKLSRLSMQKLSNWDQASRKIIACAGALVSLSPVLRGSIQRVVGIITLLTLDIHQKTSELLDLFKYISFMPFAEVSLLSKLIEDKFDMIFKTRLDVWMLTSMKAFMLRLSTPENIKAKKQVLQMFNGMVVDSSLGMTVSIPSFICADDNHTSIQSFIEEISMLYIVRGKEFYGNQFMDEALTNTVKWDHEYKEEMKHYGDWVIDGRGDDVESYPYEAKFAFSADAIYYAQEFCANSYPVDPNSVMKKLMRSDYTDFMHYTCSLRGCTKEKQDRINHTDLHTTSLDACLNEYEKNNYSSRLRLIDYANKYREPGYTAQYSMSKKLQRGPGRNIATCTIYTKAGNAVIEKPEQVIGMFTSNNIVVPGKNKLKVQSETYKELLRMSVEKKYKKIYQLTEDQSKFSENDNTRKYYSYIDNNHYLPHNVRSLQKECMKKMIGREHLQKRIPVEIATDPEFAKNINADRNGVRTDIGWPQGMLNNISTSIHSIADRWITHAFNKAYPNENIMSRGLVHSDDSWVAVGCNSMETFKKFVVFRIYAKRMFCLKANKKKIWASSILGELVSNFNIHGTVYVPVSKVVANCFNNLMYYSWPMDVQSVVSTLQQLQRAGANMGILIGVHTVLRGQLMEVYNKVGQDDISCYPVEIGGYPMSSTFELATTGLSSHYKCLIDEIERNPESKSSIITLRTMTLSKMECKRKSDQKKTGGEDMEEVLPVGLADFENVTIPDRGDAFYAIRHLLPKTTKITKSLNRLRALPFETDRMGLLNTRPADISESLGHLKEQTSTLIYALASEKLSSNARRLAVCQSLQSNGKTVRLFGTEAMTMETLREHIFAMKDVPPGEVEDLRVAFEDDSYMSDYSRAAVYHSTFEQTDSDKRRHINQLPLIDDKFYTLCSLDNVLLKIIDEDTESGGKIYNKYCKTTDYYPILQEDVVKIRNRFKTYFDFYVGDPYQPCNLIKQQYLSKTKRRYWAQPHLRNNTLENFVCDLYGKTLNKDVNYRVGINILTGRKNMYDSHAIDTIYTSLVLNTLYEDKFKPIRYDGLGMRDALNRMDYMGMDSNHFLKYAILHKCLLNDDTYIQKYDESNAFAVDYIIKQVFTGMTHKGKFITADEIRQQNLIRKEYIKREIKLLVEKKKKDRELTSRAEGDRNWRARSTDGPDESARIKAEATAIADKKISELQESLDALNAQSDLKVSKLDDQGKVRVVKDITRPTAQYSGYFEVKLRYGQCILLVKGTPGDVVITSNTNKIDLILGAMYYYIARDHNDYKYPHPGSWSRCEFWRTKTRGSNYVLHSVTSNYTRIVMSRKSSDVVGINIDKDLVFSSVVAPDTTICYELDKHLRALSKVSYKAGEKVKSRIGTVKQSLESPTKEKLILEDTKLDGYSNNKLFTTGTIHNITLRKHHSIGEGVIDLLMEDRFPPNNNVPLSNLLLQVIKATGVKNIELGEIQSSEVVEIEFEGTSTAEVLQQMSEDVPPENLEFIELEMSEELKESATGPIAKYASIHNVLCKRKSHYYNDSILKSAIRKLLSDAHTRKMLLEIKTMIQEDPGMCKNITDPDNRYKSTAEKEAEAKINALMDQSIEPSPQLIRDASGQTGGVAASIIVHGKGWDKSFPLTAVDFKGEVETLDKNVILIYEEMKNLIEYITEKEDEKNEEIDEFCGV
uniref:RNA-dependent RNA polymerase n=1 Tax=Hubei bunya-like virus 8 TaxID=1922853 RepID=A0A1L3KPI6_9VIRU|nr:RNA-dependent RNA polymerase [Hubei bunya-like virus 8]